MTPCVREQEMFEAVQAGRLNDDVELCAHSQSCESCKSVIEVALALRDDYQAAAKQAQVPSAGLVWWRAELRLRREAMRAVERPLTFVYAFAAAAILGVAAALAVQVFPWFTQHLVLALSLVATIALAPVAFYFVLSDK